MAKFVENLNLQSGLLRNLQTQNRVEIIDKTRVKEIVQGDLAEDGGWPKLELENGRQIRARLLVCSQTLRNQLPDSTDTLLSGRRRWLQLASQELFRYQYKRLVIRHALSSWYARARRT